MRGNPRVRPHRLAGQGIGPSNPAVAQDRPIMAQHDRDIVCLFKLVTKLAGHLIVDVLVIFEFYIEAHVEPIDLNQPFAQPLAVQLRSEEHTSELQYLMRTSY